MTNTRTLKQIETEIEETISADRYVDEAVARTKAISRETRLGLVYEAKAFFPSSPEWLAWAKEKWGVGQSEAYAGKDYQKEVARRTEAARNSGKIELPENNYEREDWLDGADEEEDKPSNADLPAKPKLGGNREPTPPLERAWQIVLALNEDDMIEIRDRITGIVG